MSDSLTFVHRGPTRTKNRLIWRQKHFILCLFVFFCTFLFVLTIDVTEKVQVLLAYAHKGRVFQHVLTFSCINAMQLCRFLLLIVRFLLLLLILLPDVAWLLIGWWWVEGAFGRVVLLVLVSLAVHFLAALTLARQVDRLVIVWTASLVWLHFFDDDFRGRLRLEFLPSPEIVVLVVKFTAAVSYGRLWIAGYAYLFY